MAGHTEKPHDMTDYGDEELGWFQRMIAEGKSPKATDVRVTGGRTIMVTTHDPDSPESFT